MNLEQIIYQRVPCATLLLQKFCDLELVNATMPRDLPYMANKQTIGFRGKDQPPTIFVGGRRAARASVKLPLDRRHARSIHSFPPSIYDGGRRRDERGHYSLSFIQNSFVVDDLVSSLTGAVRE
jgi:hypothetical protein